MARLSSLIVAALTSLVTAAPLHFSNVFGSHMVLQQNRQTPVWGWSDPGATVSLSYGSLFQTTATADATGLWKTMLPSYPASFTSQTITATISATGETVNITDVLMGDVYFCSGQSNMEFTTDSVFNATAEVQDANNYPYLRITSGPLQGKFNLSNVTNAPYLELAVTDLPWSVASNTSVGCDGCQGWDYFSAACYFTIRNTYNMLGGTTPIGGIVQSYGGTSIQWWSSADAINMCDTPPGSACCNYGGANSCLYNSQVAPYTIGPTQFNGVLWYQGEQNANCGGPPQIAYYECGLPAYISDMRSKFQQPDLVFGIFLLAAWQANTPYFPLLRLVQVNTSLTVPNVFTSSTLDYGEPAGGPVHSPFKQEPGRRASLGLQNLAYGRSAVAYMGPRMISSSITSTSSTSIEVTIGFNETSLYEATLVLNSSVSCPSTISSDSCENFAVQTSDCVWRTGDGNLTASLSSDGVSLVLTVTLPAGTPPSTTAVATRGLFGNWPVVQLYNVPGLPAEPWLSNISGVTNSCPSPWNTSMSTSDYWAMRPDVHA